MLIKRTFNVNSFFICQLLKNVVPYYQLFMLHIFDKSAEITDMKLSEKRTRQKYGNLIFVSELE